MCTKMGLRFSFCILLSIFGLIGCANENIPPYEIPNIQLSKADCLTKSLRKVELYFKGEASAKETDEIWTCYDYALNTFHKRVRGDNGSSYTADELRNFLETYFLKDYPARKSKGHLISDALLDEMMGVKKIFLGGSRKVLTDEELQQTLHLIGGFRRISQNLLPHTKILFVSDSKMAPGKDYFNRSQEALFHAMADLIGLMNEEGSRYEMASLTRLLVELHGFFSGENPDTTFGEVAKYIPLFSRVKALLLNSSSEVIEGREWPVLGRIFSQSLGIALRGIYYLKSDSLKNADELWQVREGLRQSVQVLREGLKRRDNVPIPNSAFEALIKEYSVIQELPLDLNVNEAIKVFRVAVDTVLDPQNIYAISGLSSEKLNYLAQELENWGYVQELLIENADDSTNKSWIEMKGVLNGPWSLSLDNIGRIVLTGERSPTNLTGSSRLNFFRALFGVLFRAYIKDPERRKGVMQLSQEELQVAYGDLEPILVGLHLVRSGDKTFHKNLYRDTNLFMPRSNGDRFIGFYELIEYLHFVYSGIDGGDYLIGELGVDCRLAEKKVVVNCFRSQLKSGAANFLSHMPRYLLYASGLSDKKWSDDIRHMEVTNRNEGASDSPIEEGDIDKIFVLLQYVESFMLRFDADRSGDIDLAEGIKALAFLNKVIGDMLGLDPDEDYDEIESLFTYMLRYGEVPNPMDPLAQLRYNNWKWQKAQWRFAATRGTLLQILASLQRLKLI